MFALASALMESKLLSINSDNLRGEVHGIDEREEKKLADQTSKPVKKEAGKVYSGRSQTV